MHRIDTATAQKDKFGAGKNGFTRGNPQTGTPATDLDDDYFDMLQEELVGVVEASGVTPDKEKRDQLLTALKKLLLSRSNPFGDIKADGAAAIATALANLGLGTAATRSVGSTNGTSQIPDMNAFGAGTQWFKLPTGNIVQAWQATINGNDANGTTINLPIAFPNSLYAANAIWIDGSSIAPITYKVIGHTKTTITIKASGSGSYGTLIIAIGI